MKNEYEDFEEFIVWLKRDGLKPKTSERLWRKKIFSNLLNGHIKSLLNYQDFVLDQKLNNMIGKNIAYKDINSLVVKIEKEQFDCILIMNNRHRLRIKRDNIDILIDNHIESQKIEA